MITIDDQVASAAAKLMRPAPAPAIVVRGEPAIVWVAAARRRNDPTRPRLAMMKIEPADDSQEWDRPYYVTCCDTTRMHQAKLPAYRLPEALTEHASALFAVEKASGGEVHLRPVVGTTKWVDWRRLMPDWTAAGAALPGIYFYEPKARCGVALGRFMQGYVKQTGNTLNIDLLRDLHIKGVSFEARCAGGAAPVMFHHVDGRVTLRALLMPLLEPEV